jgi:hypothetical protein
MSLEAAAEALREEALAPDERRKGTGGKAKAA